MRLARTEKQIKAISASLASIDRNFARLVDLMEARFGRVLSLSFPFVNSDLPFNSALSDFTHKVSDETFLEWVGDMS